MKKSDKSEMRHRKSCKTVSLFCFAVFFLLLGLVHQHKHRDEGDDGEQESDKLMRGLNKRVIYRVVDHCHRQKCCRAGVEQFLSCMYKGHTVTDGEGAYTVHHSGTKSSDECIYRRHIFYTHLTLSGFE